MMNGSSTFDTELGPPPPYTPQQDGPAPAAVSSVAASYPAPLSPRMSIRGGYMIRPAVPHATTGSPYQQDIASSTAYFKQRPYSQYRAARAPYHLVISPDIVRETLAHFPDPEDQFKIRDVQPADWSTFVHYLLPPPASKEKDGPLELKVDTARIEALVAEWNLGFFWPRGICILISDVPSQLGTPPPQSFRTMPAVQAQPAWMEHRRVGREEEQQQRQHDLQPSPWQHHRNGHHHQRSLSVSSSSSSSSSSSASSLSSLSSRKLEATSLPALRQALDFLRLSLASGTSAQPTLRKLHSDLLAQRHATVPCVHKLRNESPNSCTRAGTKELKAQLHAHKREVKAELKSFVGEVKAVRKAERKARKAEREGRRAERKAARRSRKRERKGAKLELSDAENRALEAQKRRREFEKEAEKRERDFKKEAEKRNRDLVKNAGKRES